MRVSKRLNKEILRFCPAVRDLGGKGRLGSERVCFHGLGERSSLVLPLGFHGPSCMHCSAAVWYLSLLAAAAAAALDASASAGLVACCWKFDPLQLHTSTTVKNVRTSRSLLRQVLAASGTASNWRRESPLPSWRMDPYSLATSWHHFTWPPPQYPATQRATGECNVGESLCIELVVSCRVDYSSS